MVAKHSLIEDFRLDLFVQGNVNNYRVTHHFIFLPMIRFETKLGNKFENSSNFLSGEAFLSNKVKQNIEKR